VRCRHAADAIESLQRLCETARPPMLDLRRVVMKVSKRGYLLTMKCTAKRGRGHRAVTILIFRRGSRQFAAVRCNASIR
jgi:hypothetical protein